MEIAGGRRLRQNNEEVEFNTRTSSGKMVESFEVSVKWTVHRFELQLQRDTSYCIEKRLTTGGGQGPEFGKTTSSRICSFQVRIYSCEMVASAWWALIEWENKRTCRHSCNWRCRNASRWGCRRPTISEGKHEVRARLRLNL